jgi:hypothetical protein
MDIWGPKLIWHGITCHIIIPKKKLSLFLFLPNHGLTYCIFAMPWQNYIPWKKFKVFFSQFCQQKGFDTICHDVHVYKLHLYKIY